MRTFWPPHGREGDFLTVIEPRTNGIPSTRAGPMD
jgi:hypothetical protein